MHHYMNIWSCLILNDTISLSVASLTGSVSPSQDPRLVFPTSYQSDHFKLQLPWIGLVVFYMQNTCWLLHTSRLWSPRTEASNVTPHPLRVMKRETRIFWKRLLLTQTQRFSVELFHTFQLQVVKR